MKIDKTDAACMEQWFNNLALVPVLNGVVGLARICLGIFQIAVYSLGQKEAVDANFLKHGFANLTRGFLELSYIPNLAFAVIYDRFLSMRMKYDGDEPDLFYLVRIGQKSVSNSVIDNAKNDGKNIHVGFSQTDGVAIIW